MSEIPLKLRIDIRDSWNAKDKDLQLAVEDLTKALGIRIEPEPQWPALWASLSANFPDNRYFVSSIAVIAVSWYRQLATRVEREYQREWTEELRANLQKAGNDQQNTLVIRPSDAATTVVSSGWDKGLQKFYMDIPKKIGPQFSSSSNHDFEGNFDDFFPAQPAPAAETPPVAGGNESHAEGNPGDFVGAYVELPGAPAAPPAAPGKPMRMPTLDSLPRPNELLKRIAPHYLIFQPNTFPAWIQGSHEPSLNLISEYLTRHGKTNTNDSQRRTMFQTELRESRFCHSHRDLLLIDSYVELRGVSMVNPTLLLAFIEGVLGYRRVEDKGNYWVFRHDTGFA